MPARFNPWKALAGTGAVAAFALIAGASLAEYAESGAFDFYKQRSAGWEPAKLERPLYARELPVSSQPGATAAFAYEVGNVAALDSYYDPPPALVFEETPNEREAGAASIDVTAEVTERTPVIRTRTGSWAEPAAADADDAQATKLPSPGHMPAPSGDIGPASEDEPSGVD